MVIMMMEMIGSPIMGRSTMTCSSTPKMSIKPRVSKNPQMKGISSRVKNHQHTQAPISRNSPWAKFTICEAL